MPFTIPNAADAFNANQAEPDKVDIDILTAALQHDGVLSGSAVTAQGVPDMTVAVAAGTVKVGTTKATVAAGNVTITAADATNPRFTLIVADNAGVKSATNGTAAAEPVFPAIPANSIVLAAVYVPAGATTIPSNRITDKRCFVTINALTEQVALSGVISPASLSTDQHNFDPTDLATATTIRITASQGIYFSGLAGGASGRIICWHNVGSRTFALFRESTQSVAANRFALPGDLFIPPDGVLWTQYDGTSLRWRAIMANIPDSMRRGMIYKSDTLGLTVVAQVVLQNIGVGNTFENVAVDNEMGTIRGTTGVLSGDGGYGLSGDQKMDFDLDTVVLIRARMNETVARRFFAGVSNGFAVLPPAATDHAAGFLLDSASAGTNYRVITCNGTTATEIDYAPATLQDTVFNTFMIWRRATGEVLFRLNDLNPMLRTVTLPDVTVATAYMVFGAVTTAAVVKTFDLSFWQIMRYGMSR